MILHLTFVPLSTPTFIRFLIGSLFILIGLTLFLIGVDKGITPLGTNIGEAITKTKKLWVILLTGLILGVFITLAEPGLIVFANQVEHVSSGMLTMWSLLIVVSIGIALLLAFGLYRILYHIDLNKVLTVLYLLIFVFALFTQPEFIIISFDASGATTGVLAVPFIMALAVGISHLKKNTAENEEDSFGIIAIVSAGAILSVLVLSNFRPSVDFIRNLEPTTLEKTGILTYYVSIALQIFIDTLLAMFPIFLSFLFFQFFLFKMNVWQFIKIFRGFVYAFLGLFIFLLGVNGGFMEVGTLIGNVLATDYHLILILLLAFILGITTIFAEPAVHVLTHQIEDVTSGYVSRRLVLYTLAFGVGIAISLSALRIFLEPLQIWHYLIPGYIIALTLSYIVPNIFVGIAFDAGGVATGPMTATFILAFIQGAAHATDGADIILDGFGMIAMVALMPIITLQLLGLLYKIKSRKTEV